jgi:hypothetical protein
MAGSIEVDTPPFGAGVDHSASGKPAQQHDPFSSKSGHAIHHRYSHFDTQLFSLGPGASPEQAKLALEAHLAETERRIQDASRIGTTLVQQRQELAERLQEVEKLQSESEMTPELRQRLEDLEKEYNEVGRETARVFLPKSRVSSSEMATGPHFVGEAKVRPPSIVSLMAFTDVVFYSAP